MRNKPSFITKLKMRISAAKYVVKSSWIPVRPLRYKIAGGKLPLISFLKRAQTRVKVNLMGFYYHRKSIYKNYKTLVAHYESGFVTFKG